LTRWLDQFKDASAIARSTSRCASMSRVAGHGARFREKWRLALTLLRRTRAAGVTLTAVVADAEYGDNRTVRHALHRLRLPYAVGISPKADGVSWHADAASRSRAAAAP
jgi:SRSO17 transposase